MNNNSFNSVTIILMFSYINWLDFNIKKLIFVKNEKQPYEESDLMKMWQLP